MGRKNVFYVRTQCSEWYQKILVFPKVVWKSPWHIQNCSGCKKNVHHYLELSLQSACTVKEGFAGYSQENMARGSWLQSAITCSTGSIPAVARWFHPTAFFLEMKLKSG